jgi:hypothetical protein
MSERECNYTAVCTDGPSSECGRVAGQRGGGCLCNCHPDSFAGPKPPDWRPSPLHQKAIDSLQVLADQHCLEACDPGGECYFPRCLADGCEAEPAAPSPETGTAAVATPGKRRIPPRFEASAVEEIVFEMPPLRTNSVPAGPAPEPVKPPATCETCKGARRVLYVYRRGPTDNPGNTYIPCPRCCADGTARTPAAGTTPKGEK